jgi:hypothetical protein
MTNHPASGVPSRRAPDPNHHGAIVMHTTTTTDHPDPTSTYPGTYGWSIDGHPCAGNLARYANDRAQSFYAGIPIGPLYQLAVNRDGSLHLTPADLRRRCSESGQTVRVRLQVGTDTATYTIDLRT